MLEKLHSQSFARCLHETFRVIPPGTDAFDLELIQVTEQFKTPRQEAFSIVFRGPAASFMQQGIYPLRNESLGELDLFLVPIGHDDGGYLYEAVFNRLVPAA
jgi:hypothetical protein